ncbi:4-hydroxyphenylacetate 3-monooxygenase, oxygenase component [Bacillus carboniphilus]|uniref:4-hydroxyphenylacetate 3-monooxygenase, oxygenase component n=1 Tax=Bacillus carboniphilus TaxID=86663 RepID=A0ABY9JS02_9BACI|nr:4-hydroxyphenylacetate 3-monooxygenase, oxygenase component [Bacillus carboniphilus]WLR41263.1 4-hydroxyphenylacetate 3-monooxygenase, oxygenase component [Bacillus carboniphilus]
MPAISGQQYIQRIDNMNSNVWYCGEQITGRLSKHKAYKGAMGSKARLYDLQMTKHLREKMLYSSPLSGDFVGLSFLQPKTKDDLIRKREMYIEWAKTTHGLMGRTPDYLNTGLMALASASVILKDQDNQFEKNLYNLYETAREQDLSFTHSFINPQTNRSSFYFEDQDEPIALRIVKKTFEGIIVSGARLLATEGGMTDEVLIFPTGGTLVDEQYSFAFSIPSNTAGLHFLCRNTFVQNDSTFDHPLSSQFEEMDTLLVFDSVLVPWDRVFFYHRKDIAERLFSKSGFTPHILHQVVSRQVVKTEFLLGIAQLLVETLSVSEYQHIHEKITELIIGLETHQALLYKSEKNCKLDSFGLMTPETEPLYIAVKLFTKWYPIYTEVLQLIGAGGLMILPTENDFKTKFTEEAYSKYILTDKVNAKGRTKLFRLAWDLTMSSFGTRQTLYERFFFGDPTRLATNLYKSYPRDEYRERVLSFLNIGPLDN